MNILKKSPIYPALVCAFSLAFSTQLSAEANLAEDPFELGRAKHQAGAGRDNWTGRSPEELRVWAKENLHHKLTAKRVIVAKDHPEWDWFRKSGLGLFLHWGLTSGNPQTGDAWAMVF